MNPDLSVKERQAQRKFRSEPSGEKKMGNLIILYEEVV